MVDGKKLIVRAMKRLFCCVREDQPSHLPSHLISSHLFYLIANTYNGTGGRELYQVRYDE